MGVTMRRKNRGSRDLSMATLVMAILCILVMARYTDCEIKRAGRRAQEMEAKAAAAMAEASRLKAQYLQKLERLDEQAPCRADAPAKGP